MIHALEDECQHTRDDEFLRSHSDFLLVGAFDSMLSLKQWAASSVSRTIMPWAVQVASSMVK